MPAKRDVLPSRRTALPGLEDELSAYGHDLARRGLSHETRKKRRAIAEALVEATEARAGQDLTTAAAQDFLAGRCERLGWSSKTHDNHLDSLKDFGRFLKARGAVEDNPFLDIMPVSRRGRLYGTNDTGVRAYTIEEQLAVIVAAELAVARYPKMATNRRDLCYRLFGLTGLRHQEMKLLPWRAVFIDRRPWKIVCEESWTKNHKRQEIPLNEEGVEILLHQRTCTGDRPRVWKTVPSLNTLNDDMRRAGVAKIDARGRSAGFHSFRKGLNTEGSRRLIPLEVRMRLMRHSDARLTTGTYADILTEDMIAAAAKLPRMGGLKGRQAGLVHELSTDGPEGNVDLTERPTRRHDPPRAAMMIGNLRQSTSDCAAGPGPAARFSLQHNEDAGSGPALSHHTPVAPLAGRSGTGGCKRRGGDSNPPYHSACAPHTDLLLQGDPTAVIVDALISGLLALREAVTGRPQQEPGHAGPSV